MEAITNLFNPFKQSRYDPNAFTTKKNPIPKRPFADTITAAPTAAAPTAAVPPNTAPQNQIMEQQNQPQKKAIICANDPIDYSKASVMGPWTLSPGAEERYSRRFIDTINGIPGTEPSDIHVVPSISQPVTSVSGRTNSQPGTFATRMSPQYNYYNPQNDNLFHKSRYEEPIFDSEQRISTGVLINTYTGQMYEMFENDVPPPDTSVKEHEYTEEQMTHTNPFLIWSGGGQDPNRDDPNKTEVLAYQPNADAGPNVWGDQLYADRRRSELQFRVARDMWQNQNGNLPIEPVQDRRPVGYVGYVNAGRFFPYMPATTRQFIDSKGYTLGAEPAAVQSADTASAIGIPNMRLREPIQETAYGSSSSNNSSNKNGPIYSYTGNPAATQAGSLTEITTAHSAAFDMRTPERLNSEIYMPGPIDGNSNASQYVVIDIIPRDTLKPEISEQSFSFNLPIQNSDGIGAYVLLDTTTKETLKGLMQQEFVTLPVTFVDSIGSYVVLDHSVRDTLKTQTMETNFEVAPVQYDAQVGSYVLIDREMKDTLKPIISENNFLSWVTADGQTQTAPYVILDVNVRDTLKVITGETAFAILNANSEKEGAYVVIDTDVKETLKTQLEQMFSTSAANSETTGAYCVLDTDVRDTLKGVLQTMFDPTNANSEGTGAYISFQGDLRETSRMFFENESYRPCVDGSNRTGGIPLEGLESTKAEANYRGVHDPNYFYGLSRVLADTEDTSVRQIGHTERVANREKCCTMFGPTKASLQDNLVIPVLNTSKPDAREINDFGPDTAGFGGASLSSQLPYIYNRTFPNEQIENN
jgi:hypothetical protein